MKTRTKLLFFAPLIAMTLTAFWIVDRYKKAKNKKGDADEEKEKSKRVDRGSDPSITFLENEEVFGPK